MRRFLFSVMLLLQTYGVAAHGKVDDCLDTVSVAMDTMSFVRQTPYRFRPIQLVTPGVLIGVGVIGLESGWMKHQNNEIRDELQEDGHGKLRVDDFSQYAPLVATYGLKACGVKGRHGCGDLAIISGTAYVLTAIMVNATKRLTHVERPDGSTRNSFPSGHTATAFMGAELLRREYGGVSPLLGVMGYAVATGTGFLRMYNNRHWLTDVIAGAGVGILSVELSYWLYPVISKTFFRHRYLKNAYISPCLSEGGGGVICSIMF